MKKISGANFCFWVVVLVLCFLMGFCLCFGFIFWRLAPESVWKNSLDVRSGFFWVRSLFLWFFSSTPFSPFPFLFLFKRYSSGSNRTPPTRTFLLVPFFFLCPAALVVSPVLAVRPASRRFLGVPFWAPRVFGILLVPFRGLFLGTRGGKGFPCFSCLVFLFPVLFCFAATPFIDARVGDLAEVGNG